MRINNIVLFKLAQIGESQEIDNTEGKTQVFNTLINNIGGERSGRFNWNAVWSMDCFKKRR